MKDKYLGTIIAVIVIIFVGYLWYAYANRAPQTVAVTTPPPAVVSNSVSYACEGGKTIDAVYGTNSVALTLSDARTMTLPQVISGSGIRYETGSGTPQDIAFSSEGSNAFLSENGTTTYSNCIGGTTIAAGSGDEATFTDQGNTFHLTYPKTLTLSGGDLGYTQGWSEANQTQDLGIVLASLSLPASFEPKTNFMGANVLVGTSADPDAVKNCLATPAGGKVTGTTTINGTDFTVLTSSNPGAGNYYDTTSYRTLRNSQCYSVEYTIHTTNIGNYDPNQGISAYDQSKVTDVLESVVRGFTFIQ